MVDVNNDRIQVFSPNGTFVSGFGGEGTANGRFQVPEDVAVTADGKVHVVDADNHRVQVFDPLGTYIRKYGTPGTGPGQFNLPTAIALYGSKAHVGELHGKRVSTFGPKYTCGF